MFIIKNHYYLYIENTENIDLNYIKKSKKFIIIYRNNNIKERVEKLCRFRKQCGAKGFKLYIANDIKHVKDIFLFIALNLAAVIDSH